MHELRLSTVNLSTEIDDDGMTNLMVELLAVKLNAVYLYIYNCILNIGERCGMMNV